jgi:hypothetical protein
MTQHAITVKANLLATEAENALVSGHWEEAKEKYTLVANLYKTAMSQSEDPQTLQSLKQMYEIYLDKAKQIEDYLQSTNSIAVAQEADGESDDELFTYPPATENQKTRPSLSETPLSNGLNAVANKSELNLHQRDGRSVISLLYDDYRDTSPPTLQPSYSHSEEDFDAPQQPETSSLTFEGLVWKGIEKLLDLLPKPSKRSKSKGTTRDRENSLDTSFYIMPTESKMSVPNVSVTPSSSPSVAPSSESNVSQGSVSSTSTAPSNPTNKTPREIELEAEVQRLQNIIKSLKQQNSNLLKRANATGMQSLLQENTQLKRSIILFRNEVKRKTSQLHCNSKLAVTRPTTPPICVTTTISGRPENTSPAPMSRGSGPESEQIRALESALRTLQIKLTETVPLFLAPRTQESSLYCSRSRGGKELATILHCRCCRYSFTGEPITKI